MKTKKARAIKKVKKVVKRRQVRSKAARAHIAEGTRLFALAGRFFVLGRGGEDKTKAQ
jgi:hypothetical protein